MDWTKQRAENYLTIEETLDELNQGNITIKEAKQVINTTIDKILKQSEMDIKVVAACRNLMEVIGINK